MKVAVIGGYGVFGARLVRLLSRDGHEVIVVGRNAAKATALAAEVGASSLALDMRGDLAPLFAADPDAVVDAAGPYQAYGNDPYRLARTAIAYGAHYLDLSDDAAFTAGIGMLNDAAVAAGVFALSGASSAPGLSSVVVDTLREGLTGIELIDVAILPGNRAPRGRSVMASILGQIGAPLVLRRGGADHASANWSGRRRYRLAPGLVRDGWLISVPDVRLFPDHFDARSVTFRAGLELPVMNWGLVMLRWLRRLGLPFRGHWFVSLMMRLANLLRPLGSDRGGMVVEVLGRDKHGIMRRRRWTLIAEEGEGPFIPAVTARAILRAAETIRAGARPCLGEVKLAAAERAMDDLAVTAQREDSAAPALFEARLGHDYARLPAAVRQVHDLWDRGALTGRARVDRGRGTAARLVGALFGFPAASDDVPVTVTMVREGRTERWTRRFDGKPFHSVLWRASDGEMRERFGPLSFQLDLSVEDGALRFPVSRGWCFGIALPRILLPVSETRESAEEGVFHFDVALWMPLRLGLIVRYRGWLKPDGDH
ncbi:MAG: DUF4166 domain-containing protein [Pseudomonadota bacterium]